MGRFNKTNLGMMALAVTAACGGTIPTTTGGGGASASATTGGGATTASGLGGMGSAAATTATVAVASSASSGGAGGNGDFVCDPVAAPGSLYERTGDLYGSAGPVAMCKYRGDVMLIVNTAAI
jgi:hypothetical protein